MTAYFLAVVVSMSVAFLQSPVAIYVGPQVRDGFIDTDTGIIDSIRDIKKELRLAREFTLTENQSEAVIVLFVLGREMAKGGDVVNVPIGLGMSVGAQDQRPVLRSLLKVGSYEKPMTSITQGSWTGAALAVVKDVRAWTRENRLRLSQ